MQSVKKAVILAAGFGTRFLPFTKAVSKTMLPVGDTPAIQLVVEEALNSGIEEVVIVVGTNCENILKHFSQNLALEQRIANNPEALALAQAPNKMNVKFVVQEIANGSAGAILDAQEFIRDQPFLLMFADNIMYSEGKTVSTQLIEAFERTNCHIVGVQHVAKEDATKYGCLEFSEKHGKEHIVSSLTEKPSLENVKSTLVSLGRFVMKPSYFDYLKKVSMGKNGEYSAADALANLCLKEKIIAYDFDGMHYDTGDKFGYLHAVVDFSLRNPLLGNKMKNLICQKAKQFEKEENKK